METKYETLKKELQKSMKHWDAHPLSGSAKTAYLTAKQNMIDYYNELVFVPTKPTVLGLVGAHPTEK